MSKISPYKWTIISLIPFTIMVLYSILNNDFQMQWDDQEYIVNNPTIKDWSLQNLSALFTEEYGYQYSPINSIFCLILYSIGGLNPTIFHAGSLLVHLANIILVFYFIEQIIAKSQIFNNQKSLMAGFVALVFAIHPIQVEAVAWVSASKVLLHAFFYWAGLLAYLKYHKQLRHRWLLISMLCFILSFGAKEQAILFPLALVLIDWYYQVACKKRFLLEKIPFFLMAFIMGVVSLMIFDRTGDGGHIFYPIHQRIALGAFSYLEYLFKMLVPLKISYLYFFPITIGEELPLRYYLYLLVALLMSWYIWNDFYKREKRLVVFGLILFTLQLSLFLHIIPLGRSTLIADRYAYMALPGLVLALSAMVFEWVNQHKKMTFPVLGAVILYVVILSIQANKQTRLWYNSDSLKKELNQQIEKTKLHRKNSTNDV